MHKLENTEKLLVKTGLQCKTGNIIYSGYETLNYD